MLKVNRSKDKIGPLKNNRGEIIMKDEQMCTVLNDYFLSVFIKEDVENFSHFTADVSWNRK